jgi:hypothetical protein
LTDHKEYQLGSSVNLLTEAAVAFVLGSAVPAFARPAASAPKAEQAASGAQPLTKAAKRKQMKAARKEARAKNQADLKKLEDVGYNPVAVDPNYPKNLQDAQKKATALRAASQ